MNLPISTTMEMVMLTQGDVKYGKGKKVAFGKKKAAPYASNKATSSKQQVKRKKTSGKTATGKKK